MTFCFLDFFDDPFRPDDEYIVVLKDPPSAINLLQHVWDSAVKWGDVEGVRSLLGINPELATSLNKVEDTPLHVACWSSGNQKMVKEIIKVDPVLCLTKDKHGRTPLHTAARMGRLDIMRGLVDACPQSMTEVTSATGAPLHVAIFHDQVKAMRLLVEFLRDKNKNDHDVINMKNCIGNTVLHLATSRKQLQSLKYLRVNGSDDSLLDVNAVNNGGFTVFDLLDGIPQHGKIDMEIEKILRRAGGLRARDLAPTFQTCSNGVDIDSKPIAAVPPTLSISSRNEFLSRALILTLVIAGPGLAYLSSIVMEQKCRIILPIMLVPFVSFLLPEMVTETIKKSLTYEVSLRPWLLISTLSMLGACLCLKWLI